MIIHPEESWCGKLNVRNSYKFDELKKSHASEDAAIYSKAVTNTICEDSRWL